MGFDKPKVTIDFDEYTDLIQKKSQLSDFDEKYVDDYKKVLQVLLASHSEIPINTINRHLSENRMGIQLIDARQTSMSSPDMLYKYLSVVKTKK